MPAALLPSSVCGNINPSVNICGGNIRTERPCDLEIKTRAITVLSASGARRPEKPPSRICGPDRGAASKHLFSVRVCRLVNLFSIRIPSWLLLTCNRLVIRPQMVAPLTSTFFGASCMCEIRFDKENKLNQLL